ncbi:MAG TPA: polysaccharide biosynthesis/export family protein [Bauldia sp.]|nr:polysaccharide biosynthesis/export family protein [Bauldia sp.]
MKITKWINALAGLLLLGSCSTYRPASYAVHSELVAPYRLDSGDQLRVIVFGQADLSNTYEVDKAGMISMPLIGYVPARGHTTAEVERAVAARLREGFVKNPDVSVEVGRYRPFYAMGQVNAGGQYTYVAGMTVQAAIAAAGGFTPRADMHSVTVTRSANGRIETARLRLTDPIMPGDTLFVRERIF